jgi:hypothetical protein
MQWPLTSQSHGRLDSSLLPALEKGAIWIIGNLFIFYAGEISPVGSTIIHNDVYVLSFNFLSFDFVSQHSNTFFCQNAF